MVTLCATRLVAVWHKLVQTWLMGGFGVTFLTLGNAKFRSGCPQWTSVRATGRVARQVERNATRRENLFRLNVGITPGDPGGGMIF